MKHFSTTKYKNSFCKNCGWEGDLRDMDTTSQFFETCPECHSFDVGHTSTPQRFYVDCDEDGYWYVVPVERRADFEAWAKSMDEAVCGVPPDYAKEVDICSFTFTDPK